MEYIKVEEKDVDSIIQDIFKYLPVYQSYNGQMIRVIAKNGNKVYYTV